MKSAQVNVLQQSCTLLTLVPVAYVHVDRRVGVAGCQPRISDTIRHTIVSLQATSTRILQHFLQLLATGLVIGASGMLGGMPFRATVTQKRRWFYLQVAHGS